VADDPVQDYMDARVEFAQTLSDAYRQHGKDPEVFVAGAQYALDKILNYAERYGIFGNIDDAMIGVGGLHREAVVILERAKRGEPQ
jgi:nucleotide-binding universal stress UspA family protein